MKTFGVDQFTACTPHYLPYTIRTGEKCTCRD